MVANGHEVVNDSLTWHEWSRMVATKHQWADLVPRWGTTEELSVKNVLIVTNGREWSRMVANDSHNMVANGWEFVNGRE